jgi:16S rRNA U516 pseudouridylate synthase RsuA-like enzyme
MSEVGQKKPWVAFENHTHFVLHKPVGVVSSRVDNLPPKAKRQRRTRVVAANGHAGAVPAPEAVVSASSSSSSSSPGAARPTVYDVLAQRGFPTTCGMVGRLDTETSGLLLFTSSAALNRAVSRPASRTLCGDPPPWKLKEYLCKVFGHRPLLVVEAAAAAADAAAAAAAVTTPAVGVEDAVQRRLVRIVPSSGDEGGAPGADRSVDRFLDASALEAELSSPLTFSRGGREQTTQRPVHLRVVRCWLEPYQRRVAPERGAFSAEVLITLNEGKHRQIRRVVQRAKLRVRALHRRSVAGALTCDGLAAGEARYLTEAEVATLRDALPLSSTIPPPPAADAAAEESVSKVI